MASLNNTRNLTIILITIYIFVDDFLKTGFKMLRFAAVPIKITGTKPPLKKKKLTLTEIVTLGIFRFFTGHHNWKDFYYHIKTYHSKDFPNLPAYQNFVAAINYTSPLALVLSMSFARHFRKITPVNDPKFADSSKLKACEIKREFTHKVCKGIAKKSKSTMGWFYGFKLHIVCNQFMQILSLTITPGNLDDRKALEKIWSHIFGLIIADTGYMSKSLQEKALKLQKNLFTSVRANMKKLMSQYQHQIMKLRQCVEVIFSVLKLRLKMESTLSRSPIGYFAHYCWALAAYQLKQFFKSFQLAIG